MVRGRKKTLTPDDFVTTAIAYADEYGMDALTLKALGAQMGIAHTTMYRYFRDKNDLVGAMRDRLLRDLNLAPDTMPVTPRERLLVMARQFRHAMRAHPSLVASMLLVVPIGENSNRMIGLIIEALEALGLRGRDLTRCYQQLESFVIGSTVYDLSGAPSHLEGRLERLRDQRHPDFDDITRNAVSVEMNNEAAFEDSLVLLVDHIVAIAARSTSEAFERPRA